MTLEPAAPLDERHQPTLALTFDTELVWGSFDHTSPEEFERRYPDIRATIRSLIAMLETYEVAATWAVVGHLFLSSCRRSADGVAHPDLVRPRQRWRGGDWYAFDPCTDRERDPLWYGPDVLDLLQGARVPQEIGCHSFSHILYGDPDLDAAAVDSDLRACLDIAAQRGLTLRSFVFPRNVEGHHRSLADHGFVAYRGADPNAYAAWPRPAARAAHLLSHVVGAPPPVSQPRERLPGLWNIPGSTLLIQRNGPRRAIGRAARLRRARAGIRRAVETRSVFHLWTHPFNIASDPGYLLAVLEAILTEAARERDRGRLHIATMGAIAARMAGSPGAGDPV